MCVVTVHEEIKLCGSDGGGGYGQLISNVSEEYKSLLSQMRDRERKSILRFGSNMIRFIAEQSATPPHRLTCIHANKPHRERLTTLN